MTGNAGRRLRVKVDFGSGFVNIAGARTDSLTVNREPIDVTNKDDEGVRRYLTEIGTFSVDLSVEGVLEDGELLRRALDPSANPHLSVQVLVAGIGTMQGTFFLGNFEDSGEDGANPLTFTASLMSSGSVTYTET